MLYAFFFSFLYALDTKQLYLSNLPRTFMMLLFYTTFRRARVEAIEYVS